MIGPGFAAHLPFPWVEFIAVIVAAAVIGLAVGVVIGGESDASDRALCESRGGVWLTAPVEPGCYRVTEVSDGE